MMADNPVVVEFGARIDDLVAGVSRVKEQLASVGESARSLGEILGVALSAEGIKLFIEHMAALGLQTERTMAQLGMSAGEVGMLSGLAQVTGSSMEGLALSIERMSLNIQRSTRDATNPAAQALKVLGLNAKELIGLPASEYFDKLHDSISKFNPSLNLTNAVMAVGGRGVAQMIPLLQLNGEEWEKMRQRIAEAKDGLAAAIPGMADSHAQMSLLSMAVESLGAVIFSRFKPAIDGVVKSFDDLVINIRNSIKDGGALSGTFDFITYAARLVATAIAGIISTVIGLGVAVEGLFKLVVGNIADFEANARSTSEALEKIGSDLKKRLTDIWSTPVAVTVAPSRLTAGAMDFGGADRLKAGQTALESTIKLMDDYYKGQQERYIADVAAFRISEAQKHAALLSALKGNLAFDLDTINQLETLYAKDAATKAKYEAMKAKIIQDSNNKIQKLDDDLYKSLQKDVQGYIGTIESSFNSQLRGILAGTTSFTDAMKKIFGDLIIYMIEQLIKVLVFETAVRALTAAIFPFAAAAPAAGGFGIASLFKFQTGTNYVAHTGLAMIHQGEAIVPADQNVGGAARGTGPYSGSAGASTPLTVNVGPITNNGGMSAQQIQQQARQIAAAVADVWRFQPSLRPSY